MQILPADSVSDIVLVPSPKAYTPLMPGTSVVLTQQPAVSVPVQVAAVTVPPAPVVPPLVPTPVEVEPPLPMFPVFPVPPLAPPLPPPPQPNTNAAVSVIIEIVVSFIIWVIP